MKIKKWKLKIFEKLEKFRTTWKEVCVCVVLSLS